MFLSKIEITPKPYTICLTLENSLQQSANRDSLEKNLIFIEHYVPTNQGLRKLTQEIFSCSGDQALLLRLDQMYFDYYIRACMFVSLFVQYDLTWSLVRANKGRIPTPSNHASRPSFDTIADMINDTPVEASQSHATAKKNVRLVLVFHEYHINTDQALIRDGFRCVATGIYEAQFCDSI